MSELSVTSHVRTAAIYIIIAAVSLACLPSGRGDMPGGPSPSGTRLVRSDVNGDGYEDIYAIPARREIAARLFLNNADGSFSDKSVGRGLRHDGLLQAAFADIDNDGDADAWLSFLDGTNRLLLNDGAGFFQDGVEISFTAARAPLTEILFSDIDNDGDLDIFFVTMKGEPLLIINYDLHVFKEEANARGLTRLFDVSREPAIVDINGDGGPDIMAFTPDALIFYMNDGHGHFREKGALSSSVMSRQERSIGGPAAAALSDIDIDGDYDIVLAEEAGLRPPYTFSCLRNDGYAVFEPDPTADISVPSVFGRASRIEFAEMDNLPGDDPILGRPDSIVIMDADRAGDKDMVCAGGEDQNPLIKIVRGRTDNAGWLKVKPIGVISNRDAIGAMVYVYSDGRLIGFNEVSSRRPAPLHFGVKPGLYRIEVRWPASGIVDLIEGIPPAQTVTVAEGGAEIISISLSPETWDVECAQAGDLVNNGNSHFITNRGTVPVGIDIAYEMEGSAQLLHPGREQGEDSFVTIVAGEILPPEGALSLGDIMPGENLFLDLTYGAPTALSDDVDGHGAAYELKACKVEK